MHAHHGGEQERVPVDLRARLAAFLGQGHLDREFGEVRQELVQRRVDEPDRDRQAIHLLQQPDEVLPLQGKERVERRLLLFVGGRQDDVLDEFAPLAQEHVLRAAQADALAAPRARPLRVVGGVRVRVHTQAPRRVGVAQDLVDRDHQVSRVLVVLCELGERDVEAFLEVAHHGGGSDRHAAEEHLSGGTVDGDDLTFG